MTQPPYCRARLLRALIRPEVSQLDVEDDGADWYTGALTVFRLAPMVL
jgi:hypothetical protein